MKAYATVVVTLIVLLLTSCDPAKLFIIKADNKTNASVTLYTNNKIIPFSNGNDSNKLIIHVPHNDTATKTFNYGIGNWPNEAITHLAANIDSIVIINSSGKLVLSTRSNIEAYLKKSRSGYAGSILTIQAK